MLESNISKRSKTKSTKSTKSHRGNSMKFEAGLITILVFGAVIFIIDIADKWDSKLRYIFTELILCNVIILFYQWVYLYISSVTREKRALFDEGNILETYQPRAYTHGHLFTPDPPTPGEVDNNDQKVKRSENEKNEFNRLRDAHYDNMYQKALELSKAMELENEACKAGETKKNDGKVEKQSKKSDSTKSDPEVSDKVIKEQDIIKI
uniref:Uncharacterized protein n=1 Tax=Strongyloides venezuelensis TaxID=75913 RepID=A0A0K0EU37_STRVS